MKKALDMESKGFSSMESTITREYSVFKTRCAHADPCWEFLCIHLPFQTSTKICFGLGEPGMVWQHDVGGDNTVKWNYTIGTVPFDLRRFEAALRS